jgi:hypothetical protein
MRSFIFSVLLFAVVAMARHDQWTQAIYAGANGIMKEMIGYSL